MTNSDEVKVYMFYSSRAQPGFPEQQQECIEVCEEHGIDVEIVDIVEDEGTAQEYDVISTPTVVTVNDDLVRRHVGVVGDITQVVCDDFSIPC